MQYRLDDDASLCSIDILAQAVERMSVKGVLELRMLRNALREAVSSPTPDAVQFAYAMFSRVDPDYRRMIAHEALTLAAEQKGRYAQKERVVRPQRML